MSFARTLAATLGASATLACLSTADAASPRCPESRATKKAPDDYLQRKNPVAPEAYKKKVAEEIFFGDGLSIACASCHGAKGDGAGDMASMFDPPPRNFRCKATMADVPDGQVFWVVRFGSPGTSMPPHKHLSDERIWQVVLYLRQLAN
ncbi:hypothetical protein BWI17_10140 [Betaproteobacteria bacterium GR16-43]|nr:hypothetical protein BWI17_10140 [Betaproteobacteria bacterium GR16-43]